MINAIGNAAMMDTVCRFAIELSLKMRTIGSRNQAQGPEGFDRHVRFVLACQVLVGVGGGNSTIASKLVA